MIVPQIVIIINDKSFLFHLNFTFYALIYTTKNPALVKTGFFVYRNLHIISMCLYNCLAKVLVSLSNIFHLRNLSIKYQYN